VLNPREDVERYSTAPLSTGQSVKVKDLVIIADTVGKDQASFRVFTKGEFLVKQETEAKVAAELKAKQEAEAKIAAELKAKQDAEAATVAAAAADKAAAELLAQQKAAEAKAAATKKTTITCVKGKITKKVTAVKPKCPAGYKVKK
jgi:membrane protein involved in colicin uptake